MITDLLIAESYATDLWRHHGGKAIAGSAYKEATNHFSLAAKARFDQPGWVFEIFLPSHCFRHKQHIRQAINM